MPCGGGAGNLFLNAAQSLICIKFNENRLVCLRCDGKGQYKNEFGIMEKCESCQKRDMTFERADTEPD